MFGKRGLDSTISPLYSAKTRATLRGDALLATDGILQGYEDDRSIQWEKHWQVAQREQAAIQPTDGHWVFDQMGGDLGLTPFGSPPYWSQRMGRPTPISVLAFWRFEDRRSVVRDTRTHPGTLALMYGDPHGDIQGALVMRGFHMDGQGRVTGPGIA